MTGAGGLAAQHGAFVPYRVPELRRKLDRTTTLFGLVAMDCTGGRDA